LSRSPHVVPLENRFVAPTPASVLMGPASIQGQSIWAVPGYACMTTQVYQEDRASSVCQMKPHRPGWQTLGSPCCTLLPHIFRQLPGGPCRTRPVARLSAPRLISRAARRLLSRGRGAGHQQKAQRALPAPAVRLPRLSSSHRLVGHCTRQAHTLSRVPGARTHVGVPEAAQMPYLRHVHLPACGVRREQEHRCGPGRAPEKAHRGAALRDEHISRDPESRGLSHA